MARLAAFSIFLMASSSAFASTAPWLEFQHTGFKALSASLNPATTDAIPPVMHEALLGDLANAITDNMMAFDKSYSAGAANLEGGGDGSGGLALIAGILGFFPGFGLGHLITGNIGGFLLFFIIDLVIVGVFFVVFPVLAFGFWYVPSLIVILIERIVEAFSAANSATSGHYAETATPEGEPFALIPAAKVQIPVFSF